MTANLVYSTDLDHTLDGSKDFERIFKVLWLKLHDFMINVK